MIYVASPYTHEDPAVREERYLAALRYTAKLLANKRWCFSPIVHCHDLALRRGQGVQVLLDPHPQPGRLVPEPGHGLDAARRHLEAQGVAPGRSPPPGKRATA